jgi:hypothetical protein
MRRHFWKVESWSRSRLVAFMVAVIGCTAAWNNALFGYDPDRPWLSAEGCLILCNWTLAVFFMVSIYIRWAWQSKKEEMLRTIELGAEEAERRINTGEIPITKKDDDP